MTPHPAALTRIAQNSPPSAKGASTRQARCVALIAAVGANGVIGVGNRLPWRLSDDMKRFRALTTGHTVIMGRKTWESLPRALPDRQNIVVTRQTGYAAVGAETARSFPDAVVRARLPEPVFCIGGGELYLAALPYATRLYLTEIARDFDGDAQFPPLVRGVWREIARESRPAEGPAGCDYAYVIYEREMPAR